MIAKSMFRFLFEPYSFPVAFAGAIMGAFLWVYGDLGMALGIVIGFTVADFVTGVMRAGVCGEIDSRKYMRTVHKLIGYLVVLAMLHVLVVRYIPTVPGLEALAPSLGIVPHMIAAFIVLREFSSNIENLGEAGILPERMTKVLSRVFSRIRDRLEQDPE